MKKVTKNWIVTDPSTNQQRLKIDTVRYKFKEDRIINPETGETELFDMDINIDNYLWPEIVKACGPFGYTDKQVMKWILERDFDIIAECIFEMSV